MAYIRNKVYAEIEVGDTAGIERVLTERDIQLFAVMSGDINPAHLDPHYAKSDIFKKIVAHGMWGGSLISTVLGTLLPGPGTIYLSQTLEFLRPITLGDKLIIRVHVVEKMDQYRVRLACICSNQEGKEIIRGESVVIAPTEKIERVSIILPKVQLVEDLASHYYHELKSFTKGMKPLKTAVIHPDHDSLVSAIEAAKEDLIIPVFIGSIKKIEAYAKEACLDLSHFEVIDVDHSHAAADMGAKLAHHNDVEALMKGKIHTDEFMQPILSGPHHLKTDRRMSHIVVLTVPSYHKPIFLTDVAINIQPTLQEKKDIIQNAIDLFISLHQTTPKVAILSAVEMINEKLPATIDASALCKMAERGQIKGGIIDGPLAFDNAISKEAAQIKEIRSQVAGEADILVVPNIEAGNALYKQMRYLFNIEGAGIVLGAKKPLILTSRADGTSLSRKFSCLVGLLYARRHATLQL